MHRSHRILCSLLAVSLLCLALPAVATEGAAGKTVNINTATAEQLALLPHVGPSIAQRIVEYREKSGAFKTANDLMLVRGIGEKSFALLEPYVSTSGTTTLSEKVRVPRPPKDPATR